MSVNRLLWLLVVSAVVGCSSGGSGTDDTEPQDPTGIAGVWQGCIQSELIDVTYATDVGLALAGVGVPGLCTPDSGAAFGLEFFDDGTFRLRARDSQHFSVGGVPTTLNHFPDISGTYSVSGVQVSGTADGQPRFGITQQGSNMILSGGDFWTSFYTTYLPGSRFVLLWQSNPELRKKELTEGMAQQDAAKTHEPAIGKGSDCEHVVPLGCEASGSDPMLSGTVDFTSLRHVDRIERLKLSVYKERFGTVHHVHVTTIDLAGIDQLPLKFAVPYAEGISKEYDYRITAELSHFDDSGQPRRYRTDKGNYLEISGGALVGNLIAAPQ